MVDFQSRDTRRGPSLDDEDDAEDDDTATDDEHAGEEQGSETTPDGDGETETADDEGVSSGEESESPAAESAGSETADDPLATGSDEADAADDPLATGSAEAGTTEDPLAADSADTATTEATPDGDADQSATDQTAPQTSAATTEATVQAAVVTVGMDGDERVETALATAFESAGHSITVRERLRGEYDSLQQVVDRLVDRGDVDVVVTAGGIGIGVDEVTIEAVHPLFEKALPGFGEAFRALLFEHIGTGIVSVRSTAGVANGTLVFCLPGDVDAAELAVEEILAPETPALVASLR